MISATYRVSVKYLQRFIKTIYSFYLIYSSQIGFFTLYGKYKIKSIMDNVTRMFLPKEYKTEAILKCIIYYFESQTVKICKKCFKISKMWI